MLIFAQDKETAKHFKEDYPEEVFAVEDRISNIQIRLNEMHGAIYHDKVKDGARRPMAKPSTKYQYD